MTPILGRARSAGAYPGPSREELGDLAEWVSESEFSEAHDHPRVIPDLPPVTEAALVQRRVPKPYSGPTREELGDLAQWLDAEDSHRSVGGQGPPSPATSLRAIDAELRVPEMEAGETQSDQEPKGTCRPTPRPTSSDPFLDQLDEIQADLVKRAS